MFCRLTCWAAIRCLWQRHCLLLMLDCSFEVWQSGDLLVQRSVVVLESEVEFAIESEPGHFELESARFEAEVELGYSAHESEQELQVE